MKEFDRLKDLVFEEIEELSHRPQLDKESICVIGELVDILKDTYTIEMFEEGYDVPEDEYRGYSQRSGYPKYYDSGNSYRGRSYGGYSRRVRPGYSREDGKAHMVEKLEALMNEAQDENDRMAIKDLINQMR